MPRSSARDRILDAFAGILIDQGERGATLAAVAAATGMSKGGLLYHFGSKEALAQGLLDRLEALAAEDRKRMAQYPDGAISYYLRTSGNITTDTPFERAALAAFKLSDAADQAKVAFARVQRGWFDLILAETGDLAVTQMVMLIGDGMYYNACLYGHEGGTLASAYGGVGVATIREIVERLRGPGEDSTG